VLFLIINPACLRTRLLRERKYSAFTLNKFLTLLSSSTQKD